MFLSNVYSVDLHVVSSSGSTNKFASDIVMNSD